MRRRRKSRRQEEEEEATRQHPPEEARPQVRRRVAITLVACVTTALVRRLYAAYELYGIGFFVPFARRLDLTAREWQELLRERSVLFVGGHHRSGTTILSEHLGRHPSVASFRDTGTDYGEGASLQDVYPTFGIGRDNFVEEQEENLTVAETVANVLREVWTRTPVFDRRRQRGGLGRYALREDAHWTETSPKVIAGNQMRVLNRFGYFWTERGVREKAVLLEKSPPNVVVARFLQALVNVGQPGWTPAPPSFGGVRGAAKFLFIQRHPLATALAHLEWRECEGMRLTDLVAHWVAVSYYVVADRDKLQYLRVVTLEDFVKDPAAILEDLWAGFLGLDDDVQDDVSDVQADPNAKYRRKYCDHHIHTHDALVHTWGASVRTFGYDLDSWDCRVVD